jgi:hypothetical protein
LKITLLHNAQKQGLMLYNMKPWPKTRHALQHDAMVTYSIRNDRFFLIHHIYAFTIHITVLILLNNVLIVRSSSGPWCHVPQLCALEHVAMSHAREHDSTR